MQATLTLPGGNGIGSRILWREPSIRCTILLTRLRLAFARGEPMPAR